jgi:hypothetical protein
MPPRRAPTSVVVRRATEQAMLRRLRNLQREAQRIISTVPRQMRLATQRNRTINETRRERARTYQGRAMARRTAARTAVLQSHRMRVTQENINRFKRMLYNVSAPRRRVSTSLPGFNENQYARNRFNFHNIPTLNRAWNTFKQGAHHPYGYAPYYAVPNSGENTYQRIRQHYARVAQRAELNARIRQLQTLISQARRV